MPSAALYTRFSPRRFSKAASHAQGCPRSFLCPHLEHLIYSGIGRLLRSFRRKEYIQAKHKQHCYNPRPDVAHRLSSQSATSAMATTDRHAIVHARPIVFATPSISTPPCSAPILSAAPAWIAPSAQARLPFAQRRPQSQLPWLRRRTAARLRQKSPCLPRVVHRAWQ